ncbi:MAG: hypothetical protein BGP09_13245 [Rhizobium sp. 60-20]|nr:MAG: hypothetical protein BGP09_13245 [Rhizobium sp. 60-20]
MGGIFYFQVRHANDFNGFTLEVLKRPSAARATNYLYVAPLTAFDRVLLLEETPPLIAATGSGLAIACR